MDFWEAAGIVAAAALGLAALAVIVWRRTDREIFEEHERQSRLRGRSRMAGRIRGCRQSRAFTRLQAL
jgi:hypothetical protein